MKTFITAGAEVDVAHEGITPLQFAAKNGHESIMTHLLSLDANVNSERAKDSFKPILHAANKGCTTMIKLLLHHEVLKVCQSNSDGHTALHLAAQNGYEEITRLLLDRMPDIMARDRVGRTALHLASLNEHSRIVEILVQIEPGPDIGTQDDHGDTPLRLASKKGHTSVVELLLECGARVDSTGTDHHTALYSAIFNGHEATAEMILQRGIAMKTKFADIVGVLLEAAKRGFYQVCKLSLKSIDGETWDYSDSEQWTALHYAAQNGYEDIVALLVVDDGSLLDSENDKGETPLVLTAFSGRWKTVQVMLNREADLSKKNSIHQTLVSQLAALPLQSCTDGHVKTIRTLLKAGIVADHVDNENRSALHYAAMNGNLKIAQELLSWGADLTLRDFLLWTPLHYVARKDKDTSEILLKHKADAQACDDDGWTPFHLAAQYDKVDVMEVL